MMTTIQKNNIIALLNNGDALNLFINLKFRWMDEGMYEDFNEYTKLMAKYLPKDAQKIQGTKRPFGVKCIYGGEKLHIFVKQKVGGFCLCAKMG